MMHIIIYGLTVFDIITDFSFLLFFFYYYFILYRQLSRDLLYIPLFFFIKEMATLVSLTGKCLWFSKSYVAYIISMIVFIGTMVNLPHFGIENFLFNLTRQVCGSHHEVQEYIL